MTPHPLVIAEAYEGYAASWDESVKRCALAQFRNIDPRQYLDRAEECRRKAAIFRAAAAELPADLGRPVCPADGNRATDVL